MSTFYLNDNKIIKWDNKIDSNFINFGDPITIEYKKIRIVTSFNKFFKNKIMILNNIKDKQTKEKAIDSITYYDEEVDYKTEKDYEYYDISDFDPSKYGNSICYYNCGYENNNINIVTRFYKIKNSHFIENALSSVGKLITLGSVIPNYGILFSIAGKIVESTENIISNFKNNGKKIVRNHVITFRNNDPIKPFLKGLYLCIPDMDDENLIEDIIKNYYVENYCLLKKDSDNLIEEYPNNYFILEVSVGERKELLDFNFTASSNELLENISHKSENSLNEFLECSKNSSDLNLIKKIITEWNDNKDPKIIKSMINHLHDKEWFKENFSEIYNHDN